LEIGAVEIAGRDGGRERAVVFVVDNPLNRTRAEEIAVDVFYAVFVECCVGFAEGESVGWEEGLVRLPRWEREGRWEGGEWAVDGAAGWGGGCRGGGYRGKAVVAEGGL